MNLLFNNLYVIISNESGPHVTPKFTPTIRNVLHWNQMVPIKFPSTTFQLNTYYLPTLAWNCQVSCSLVPNSNILLLFWHKWWDSLWRAGQKRKKLNIIFKCPILFYFSQQHVIPFSFHVKGLKARIIRLLCNYKYQSLVWGKKARKGM
jgi:hypothetical protein